MQGNFFGHMDCSVPAGADTWRVEPGRVSWPGGEISWRKGSEVSFAISGDRLCISTGRPRFPRGTAGDSDAARWLAAYERQGEGAAAAVGGGWAVVILSPAAGGLFLAVDRFAIHTACHAQEGKRIAFAERADEVPALDRQLDLQSLYDYLHFHVIPAPATVFRVIRRLPAGHSLASTSVDAAPVRYWSPDFAEPGKQDFPAQRQEFLRLVRTAVEGELDGRRPGAFLSGGTDSSTVAGMLCRVTGAAIDTYSIGFDAAGYDEMEYARIASRHFRTRHHEYYVTPDDVAWGIPAVAAYYDQPFGNSSTVPAYLCARLAAGDGISRLLAGDGGDELFGGNSRYATQQIFDAYRHLPEGLRQGVLEPLIADAAWTRKVPLLKQAGGYLRHSRVPMPERMETFNLLDRLGAENMLTSTFLAGIDGGRPLEQRRATWQACPDASLINRMLAYDWKFTLADNDLPKVRGATRMAGVEVGFPFLDTALADFSLGLPPSWKVRRLQLRWFFKEALRGFLPEAIIKKKKHGFGLPFGPWTVRHAGLRQLAGDSLDSLVERGMLRGDFVHDLFAHRLPEHPGYYGEMIWILTMLEQWLQKHSPEFRL